MAEGGKYILEHEKQIFEYKETINQLKMQTKGETLWSKAELDELEDKLEDLKKRVYANLTPWERVAICRHPHRPHSIDYIKNICEEFEEIHGDRLYRDDPALIAGFGKIDGKKFAIIGQEKGNDTNSRVKRNFGMLHPEGYRKALRCMKLAEKFKLPILSLLDTPGAYPGLSAEERGQGRAIALNLLEMSKIETPIIVVLIGEGCSGGALGMGVGDVIGMLRHSYYSVISPEGCASILWKDASKNSEAAQALKMHAEDLLQFGVIDIIIEEPLGGAHHDPKQVYQNVKNFVLTSLDRVSKISPKALLKRRYRKFRSIGEYETAH